MFLFCRAMLPSGKRTHIVSPRFTIDIEESFLESILVILMLNYRGVPILFPGRQTRTFLLSDMDDFLPTSILEIRLFHSL